MELEHKLAQNLSPSHNLVESMKILQMTDQELSAYISLVAESNPVLDLEMLSSKSDIQLSIEKLNWISEKTIIKEERGSDSTGERPAYQFAAFDNTNSLKHFLWLQVLSLKAPEIEKDICEYLIDCVDYDGYMDIDANFLSHTLSISIEMANKCISIMRSLEPTGICSANMKMCLLRQAEELGDALLVRLIETKLSSVLKGHFCKVAKELKIDVDSVKCASYRLRQLNPVPGRLFDCHSDVNVYLYADIILEEINGDLTVSLAKSYIPHLHIDGYYEQMLRSTDDEEVRDYLSRKLYSAEKLIENIAQRERTVLKCAKAIVQRQKTHLLYNGQIVALSEADIAQELNMDISTVSRAIRGKNIQCNHGILPLKCLFARDIKSKETGASHSVDKVKKIIAEIISSEDVYQPYSDQCIKNILRQKYGIEISRRTVFNYRSELNIPNSYARGNLKANVNSDVHSNI